MAEIKRVTLHPMLGDGTLDTNVSLYPKALVDGIVDRDGNPVEVALKDSIPTIPTGLTDFVGKLQDNIMVDEDTVAIGKMTWDGDDIAITPKTLVAFGPAIFYEPVALMKGFSADSMSTMVSAHGEFKLHVLFQQYNKKDNYTTSDYYSGFGYLTRRYADAENAGIAVMFWYKPDENEATKMARFTAISASEGYYGNSIYKDFAEDERAVIESLYTHVATQLEPLLAEMCQRNLYCHTLTLNGNIYWEVTSTVITQATNPDGLTAITRATDGDSFVLDSKTLVTYTTADGWKVGNTPITTVADTVRSGQYRFTSGD